MKYGKLIPLFLITLLSFLIFINLLGKKQLIYTVAAGLGFGIFLLLIISGIKKAKKDV